MHFLKEIEGNKLTFGIKEDYNRSTSIFSTQFIKSQIR